MIRKAQPTVQLNVRISPALNNQLERLAVKAGLDKRALVSGTLKAYSEAYAETVKK